MGQPFETNHKMWFYFSVTGIPTNQTFSFLIDNSNNCKLYKEGFRPVFKNASQDWQYLPKEVFVDPDELYLRFTHTFLEESKHYFAFSFPFS